MVTITEVKKLALGLPQTDRAKLIAHLLDSLPAVLSDGDGGMTEALRRDEELEAGVKRGVSMHVFEEKVRARRG